MSPIPEGAAAVDLPTLDDALLATIAAGSHHDPHSILGQHQVAAPGVADPVTVIRALRPLAQEVFAALPNGAHIELGHVGHGVWQGVDIVGPGAYLIEARYDDGSTWTADDPYRFLPTIGELDLHLIREGRHETLWTALGAHIRDLGGVVGTAFTVWAPHARAVRVVGDFNGWDGTLHSMRNMGASGVWELFVPGLSEGQIYKYDLLAQDGQWVRKIDPLAQLAETPPAS